MASNTRSGGTPFAAFRACRPNDWKERIGKRATTHAVNPRFIAVLLPLPAEAEEPGVSFESSDGKRIVRIEWPAHIDTLAWSEADGSATLVDAR